jgi:non-ribosomal peptide synthetase component F
MRPGDIVGLWMPRGIALLVMQAAIAKAGAAWLPVDEDTPVERLLVCMDDAGSPAWSPASAWRRRAAIGRPVCTWPKRCWRRRPTAKCWPAAAPSRATCRPT